MERREEVTKLSPQILGVQLTRTEKGKHNLERNKIQHNQTQKKEAQTQSHAGAYEL